MLFNQTQNLFVIAIVHVSYVISGTDSNGEIGDDYSKTLTYLGGLK